MFVHPLISYYCYRYYCLLLYLIVFLYHAWTATDVYFLIIMDNIFDFLGGGRFMEYSRYFSYKLCRSGEIIVVILVFYFWFHELKKKSLLFSV